MIEFEGYDSLLPPHWIRQLRYDEDGSPLYYFRNEINGEESSVNPFQLYLNRKNQANHKSGLGFNCPPKSPAPSHSSFPSPASEDVEVATQPFSRTRDDSDNELPMKMPEGRYYEYYSTWSERDLYGRVTPYGITIRYFPNGADGSRTLIKFDGIVAEWIFSQLHGPFGPLEQLDLFIGAKIKIFGRQLSITAASAASINWIENQRKKLESLQEVFRNKVMSVNAVPCVKSKSSAVPVRNITRNRRAPGQCDLRRLHNENARLGEQIAALGLAPHIF